MSSVKNIPFDQIQTWVRGQQEKGRPMREIVAQLATRNDVTVLPVKDSPEKRHQLIAEAISQKAS
ncbi:MAG: hypothetical protein ACRDEA_05165 [Microcystaceae cyanobacterium]